MFFLAKGLWKFELSHSMYGDKTLNWFELRGCRVGEPNICMPPRGQVNDAIKGVRKGGLGLGSTPP